MLTGLRRASFNLEDGARFIYITAVDDKLEANPLPQMDAQNIFGLASYDGLGGLPPIMVSRIAARFLLRQVVRSSP